MVNKFSARSRGIPALLQPALLYLCHTCHVRIFIGISSLKSKLEIIDTYYHHLLVDVIDMQVENVQLNLTTVDISRLV